MIKTIPLNKLIASPRNVRRAKDAQADLELLADIEAHGLLQNLVVTSAKPRGCFAVEAGERRRCALQALADAEKLAADFAVPCLVLDKDEAQEASLAENFQRLAMNPADECLAFQALIEQGAEPETIAKRFGLTVRFVEGRLRLAGLAPVVFEALGSGSITLDVAKAYAASSDQDRQAYVFEQVGHSYGANHPDSIRRMMTQATIGASDRRARFVGEEAYVAVGGRVERDLFSEDGQARWLDVDIVERLATEKMDALAAEAQAEQRFAFVRPTLEGWVGYPLTDGLRRVRLETPPLTDEESARVEALEEEIGKQVDLLEDEDLDEEARGAAEQRLSALDGEVDAIVNKPPVLDDDLRGRIGAFLILGDDGEARLDGAFYAEIEEADATPPDESSSVGGESGPSGIAAKPPVPRRLLDELAMQRRDVLAAHISADPGFARDLAAFLMVDRELRYAFGGLGSSLSAAAPTDPVVAFRTPSAAATVALEKTREALDRSWTEEADQPARFDAFRALPETSKSAWLAHAVARTLEASTHVGERGCTFHDHLGTLLGIDVAAWWRPTGANYFDRVPKSLAFEALAEVGGPELAARYAKSKKSELAEACERIFAGDVIADVETKAAAVAWVPPAMRFSDPEAPPEIPADAGQTVEDGPDLIGAMDGEIQEIGEAA